MANPILMKNRFDGYLPVVVDIETSGVDVLKNAMLEIAAVSLDFNVDSILTPVGDFACHVTPFDGARLDDDALKVTGIDPFHPFRFDVSEQEALTQLFQFVEQALKNTGCRRAVLVGHNAHFDLSFIMAAAKRCKIKETPFHAFTVFDTATLGGLVFGKTVLAKALRAARLGFDKDEAHSAIYDAKQTAALFCHIVNRFR
ncbi:MAG: ribonuclease T [Gammaproteobacteria bacterium RIFCSPLOWO2_02_FULL_42_14]|nr:MAG: ribonuclease T [Gammaproteobacteria bacterium RIFCSPHIGHO2_02_FULL_42_43]OGT28779.1 MAG: ribonuclease T [Gammaproteobacteria bacterium RIFCSPHIGHO2_01_FULL_42_8]OGT53525.1 MAG: ribonuclease T [Gammaproteobacteria bacterium RIFCSPHIGHO2_12_FULL_41_25]OGT61469.1 MAG: ribonuclease T [Gammaproteobacteria bacterium RIFCSPLOWO2_02_FULL_42_14]OGT86763.1 MAG: ribonuclease T [Gammaproteobacteria bacterium RIFCSPLOWO2_12_FULL_42_18]